MFDHLSVFYSIESAVNSAILRVGIAQDHLQAFMTGEFLNCLEICAGHSEAGNRGMTHNVRRNRRIEASMFDAAHKGSIHLLGMTTDGDLAGENPAILVGCHFPFLCKNIGDAPRKGLLAPLAALDAHPQPTPCLVKVLETCTQDL